MGCCKERRVLCLFGGWFLLALGAAAVVLAVVLPDFLQHQANEGVADKYAPEFGTAAFDEWAYNDQPGDPPEYMVFYLFNLSNAPDVLYHGATPIVKEIGPFVYSYVVRKQDFAMSYDAVTGESSMSYRKREVFEIARGPVQFINNDGTTTTVTSLDPSMNLTLPNPVLFGAEWQGVYDPDYSIRPNVLHELCLKFAPVFKSKLDCFEDLLHTASKKNKTGLIAGLLEGHGPKYGLFPTRSVDEWLGLVPGSSINSTILAFLNKYVRHETDSHWGYLSNSSLTTQAAARKHLNLETVRWNRNNLSSAGSYLGWQGNNVLRSSNQYDNGGNTPHIGNVLNYQDLFVGWGHEIDFSQHLFRPNHVAHTGVESDEQLLFWLSAGARYIISECTGETHVKGVKALIFQLSPDSVDPDSGLPGLPNNETFFCTIPGLANETQYHDYGPIFVTEPHFAGSYEAQLRERYPIEGMSPAVDSQHRTFIDVEPTSGLVINAAERIQVNVMTPYDDGTVMDFESIGLPYHLTPQLLIPAFWFELRSNLNSHDAKQLKLLQDLPKIKKGIKYGGAVGGAFLLFGGLLVLYRRHTLLGRDEHTGGHQSGSATDYGSLDSGLGPMA